MAFTTFITFPGKTAKLDRRKGREKGRGRGREEERKGEKKV